MKKLLFISLMVTTITILFSQDGVIGLKNNTKTTDAKTINRNDKKSEESFSHRNPLLPKSIYIGELGDFESSDINRTQLLKSINIFLTDIKDKNNSNLLEPSFNFIFNKVYGDSLMGEGVNLIRWNLGYAELFSNIASMQLELYFRDKFYVGSIYLEHDEKWLVNDLQIEVQEKKVFDPSSPY